MKIHWITLSRNSPSLWIIAAYFLFVLLFVSIGGNFPLNDDWSYGEGVRGLLQTGQLNMPTVCAAGLAHVYLATVVCKIFGYSYVVLRSVVFALGFAGALALYGVMREVGLHRNVSTFCSLVYASSPIMINLCFSFMSDITALSLVNGYFYFLVRSIRRNSIWLASCALVLLVLAIASRQSSIIFLPCALSLLALSGKDRKVLSLLTLAWLTLPCLTYAAMDYWLSHRELKIVDYTAMAEGHWQFIKQAIYSPACWFHDTSVAAGQVLCYIGLFCLPALLPFVLRCKYFASKYRQYVFGWLLIALLIAGISAFDLVKVQGKLMPFNQNILRLPMVCALTIMGLNMPLLSPKILKWLTALSFILAITLLTVLGCSLVTLIIRVRQYVGSKSPDRLRQLAINWICIISAVLSVIFCTVETVVRCSDRYYMIALAPVLMALALSARWLKLKLIQPITVALLVLIAFYSACAAQDYLGWNRARWIGLERLEAMGIPSTRIDGGVEYNTVRDISIYRSPNHGKAPQNKWRWWGIKGEDYIVSFSPIPGYRTLYSIPYWSALGFKKREVLVLKNENL